MLNIVGYLEIVKSNKSLNSEKVKILMVRFFIATFQGLYTNLLFFLDPFNLNHNVGGGVRKNIFQYIMACFFEGRERSGDCDQNVSPNIDLTLNTSTSNSDTLKDGERYDIYVAIVSQLYWLL